MPTTTCAAPDVVLDGTGQQRDRDAELRADRVDCQEVLLGQRLGRRHQRAALPCLHGPQERVERDHGLARPNVPLQEALHRALGGQVRVDLGDRALLARRQLEREDLAVARHELAGLAERRRAFLVTTLAAPRQPDLERQ